MGEAATGQEREQGGMVQATWTHLLARRMVRPLLGTGITPNHLTTARLLTGLAGCAGLALGTHGGRIWGGALWLLSTFLDRADGELARIGHMSSEAGHRYDYRVDNLVTALFFVAAGLGERGSWLGPWSVPLGVQAAGCLLLCNRWSEALEARNGRTRRAYAGRWGFDLDDLLYLMAPLAWLNWLAPIVVGAAIGTALMAVLTGLRLRRIERA